MVEHTHRVTVDGDVREGAIGEDNNQASNIGQLMT